VGEKGGIGGRGMAQVDVSERGGVGSWTVRARELMPRGRQHGGRHGGG